MIEILLHRVWLLIWRLFTPATFIEFYTNVDSPSILTNYLLEVFESYIIMIIAYYIINVVLCQEIGQFKHRETAALMYSTLLQIVSVISNQWIHEFFDCCKRFQCTQTPHFVHL